MMDYQAYAGIGSKETPPEIMVIMTNLASKLEKLGYTLRSGGAKGADTAFEAGVKDPRMKEIYLPNKGFNRSTSELYLDNIDHIVNYRAFDIANFYLNYDLSYSGYTANLMTRNVLQVMGQNLEPLFYSKFVICWTRNGKDVGGTGLAIRIAKANNIPVYNLKNEKDISDLSSLLLGME